MSLVHPIPQIVSTSVLTEAEPTNGMKKRCACCKAKLPLTAFACRCGGFYCSQHRSDVEHKCSYDYKADYTKALSTTLVKVVGQKLDRV